DKKSQFVSYMDKNRDPFKTIISCILSLRTKDETTYGATLRLFSLGSTPNDFLKLSEEEIQKAIYPVGFYRNKAKVILGICQDLLANYNGLVPDDIDELLKLKGVGRKTANLVVSKGYDKPAICVDTHVHRISNRLGYVKTKTPDETEMALREKLPVKYWLKINDLLVTHGQNTCKPIGPKCTICIIEPYCNKILF
ncbi:MAG: endonuclease III, partial [Candidatus Melainabacteria bacterium RIFOXYA12_FULL_32_12]